MKAPQIIMICILSVGTLINVYVYGKGEKKGKDLWTSLLATGLMTGLLIWGGFFK